MDKNDLKDVINRAKADADKGIKKVGAVAKKAVGEVNESLDAAKEAVLKNAYAKDTLKVLQDGIKELEKENKTKATSGIQEETQDMIDLMKELYQKVKKDPENCEEKINLLIEVFRGKKVALNKEGLVGQELLKMQVLTKRYDDALETCLSAKKALNKE